MVCSFIIADLEQHGYNENVKFFISGQIGGLGCGVALQTVYTASREWLTIDENGCLVFDEKAEQFFKDCVKFHIENYCGGREDFFYWHRKGWR